MAPVWSPAARATSSAWRGRRVSTRSRPPVDADRVHPRQRALRRPARARARPACRDRGGDRRPGPQQLVRPGGQLVPDVARNGEDRRPLRAGPGGGDERAAPGAGPDHHHRVGQPRDDAVPGREVVAAAARVRRAARRRGRRRPRGCPRRGPGAPRGSRRPPRSPAPPPCARPPRSAPRCAAASTPRAPPETTEMPARARPAPSVRARSSPYSSVTRAPTSATRCAAGRSVPRTRSSTG